MIVSVSRRTDIPAYYSEWFFNRLKEGYVLVRNPLNSNQVSKISLAKEYIDCFVFWTKNPEKMLGRIDELKSYNYYFQFTLNSYDESLETNVPRKKQLISTFQTLSEMIGKKKVIWRYDPIILTDKFTKDYHYKYFDYLCQRLCGYTSKCIISFVDLYTKTERNMKGITLLNITSDEIEEIAYNFSKIAAKYALSLETCAERIDLSKYGITHSKCIDDSLISDLFGYKLKVEKDPNQREECGCVKSIDIGAYNTCSNNCLYCYANASKTVVDNNILCHNPASPLILGELKGTEKITNREMTSYYETQTSIFDIIK